MTETKAQRPGRAFEEALARILAALDPQAQVRHDERIIDRTGHSRQFDVTIRGTVAGTPILGVVECKDHGRKVTVNDVEAFAAKATNVGAGLKVFASAGGFSKTALERARFEGIQPVALVSPELEGPGWRVGGMAFVTLWNWAEVRASVSYEAPAPLAGALDLLRDRIRGETLYAWFRWRLFQLYGARFVAGWAVVQVEFAVTEPLQIGDQVVGASAITFWANRVVRVRRRFMNFHGDGLLHLESSRVSIPPHGTLSSQPFKASFEDWEPHEGPIPDPTGPLDARMNAAHIPDLTPIPEEKYLGVTFALGEA